MPEVECGFDGFAQVEHAPHLLVQLGPTLQVDIGFDPDFRPGAPITIPKPGLRDVESLVDTGAAQNCIDNLLAARLELPIVDRLPISGSGGRHEVNVHLAQIHVPSLECTIYGSFYAVNLTEGGQWHQALIGRSFLMHFRMEYDGTTGKVKLVGGPGQLLNDPSRTRRA